jgi:hypothetical protein
MFLTCPYIDQAITLITLGMKAQAPEHCYGTVLRGSPTPANARCQGLRPNPECALSCVAVASAGKPYVQRP